MKIADSTDQLCLNAYGELEIWEDRLWARGDVAKYRRIEWGVDCVDEEVLFWFEDDLNLIGRVVIEEWNES